MFKDRQRVSIARFSPRISFTFLTLDEETKINLEGVIERNRRRVRN